MREGGGYNSRARIHGGTELDVSVLVFPHVGEEVDEGGGHAGGLENSQDKSGVSVVEALLVIKAEEAVAMVMKFVAEGGVGVDEAAALDAAVLGVVN